MKSMMLAKRPEIRALGWMADGSPIWPISGSDPEPVDPPEGGGTTDPANAGGEPTGDPGAGDPANPGTPPDPTALLNQIELLTRRLNAADTAKGAAEKRLREIDDQGKTELQKLQQQNQELAEKLAAEQAARNRATLEREVLKFPGYVWHNQDAVLTLIDMSGIEIDEATGKVTGVAPALKALAAAHPYLLKGKNPDGGGQGGQSQPGGKPAGASGTNPTGGTSTPPEKRRQELAAKYRL